MTLGTTGIGSSGQGFFITALSVLTYKHFCILSIHCQKLLSAVRADFVCKIIMPEGSLSGFDLIYNVTGIVPYFFQEGFLFHFTFCNISKLHLPVCGQFRLAQFLGYQFQKLLCLGGQMDFIAFFLHQKAVKQFLNNIGPCGNSPQTTCLTESFRCLCIMTLHIAHRILHCCKKRCFCESCRWLCPACIHGYILYMQSLTFLHLWKLLIFQFLCIVSSILILFSVVRIFIHIFPSGTFYNFPAGSKKFSSNNSLHAHLFINKRRIQHTEESANYHIVNLTFFICHMVKLHKLLRRDNCMMVADLFIIHKTSICTNRLIHQCACRFSVRSCCAGSQSFFNCRNNILSNISGICPRISEYFVILIQTLHDIQSLLCRISIFPICLSLQCGQVIQTRCKGFFLFAGYGSYFQRLISENIGNLLCPFFIKSSEALTLWFLPCPGDITCFQGDSVIFLRLKCPYLFFPFRNHRQCRSLYTPAGKLGIIFTGKCPCTVHSHQPVSFRSCHSCSVQIIILMSVFQISESFFDSFVCN